VLTLVGTLVGLVAARGVWFVHGGLKQLTATDPATEGAMETFISLQSDLRRFLDTLAAILGLLILSTGAQRRVRACVRPEGGVRLRARARVRTLFSILVAAVYLPTYATLTRVGNGILDTFFPRVSPASPEWEDRTAKREKLTAVLGLQDGPLVGFRASAAILTPFVGSLIALVLDK
jgi:hypothetical protein